MAGKGLIAFIVLCHISAIFASNEAVEVVPDEAGSVAGVVKSSVKSDGRLFFADGTQITVGTETLALGVLLVGLLALALLLLPGLLGAGGDTGAAVAYDTAPSTYAQDPYAARSARSVPFAHTVLTTLEEAAKKFL